MSFYQLFQKHKNLDFTDFFQKISDVQVQKAIHSAKPSIEDFLTLLSPLAEKYLEEMAQKANQLTTQYFGKEIGLYTPMYLANYCVNQCRYCGFNALNDTPRKKMTLEEVEKEAQFISKTGLQHILILTGESRQKSSVAYILDCVRVLKKYFSSIAIEIYILDEAEYRQMVEAGVDGLTVYQEVYNEKIYDYVHKAGPKKDYKFRLDALERGAKAGMRFLNLAPLLGLDDWRSEVFFCGLHAQYLQDKFPESDIGFSIPRIRPHEGEFQPKVIVTDQNVVQLILAMRIFLPKLGVNVSTRENAEFRENLLPLGVTKMSAGVTTAVGGHTAEANETEQFQIADERSVDEMKAMLLRKGYQPVLKNWMRI